MLPQIAMFKAFIKVNNQCSCIEALCLMLIGPLLCGVRLHSSTKELATKAIRQVSMVAVLLLLFPFVTQTVSKYSLLNEKKWNIGSASIVRKLVFGCNAKGGHAVYSDFLSSNFLPSKTSVPLILLHYVLLMTFSALVLLLQEQMELRDEQNYFINADSYEGQVQDHMLVSVHCKTVEEKKQLFKIWDNIEE